MSAIGPNHPLFIPIMGGNPPTEDGRTSTAPETSAHEVYTPALNNDRQDNLPQSVSSTGPGLNETGSEFALSGLTASGSAQVTNVHGVQGSKDLDHSGILGIGIGPDVGPDVVRVAEEFVKLPTRVPGSGLIASSPLNPANSIVNNVQNGWDILNGEPILENNIIADTTSWVQNDVWNDPVFEFVVGDDLEMAFSSDSSTGERALGFGFLALNIPDILTGGGTRVVREGIETTAKGLLRRSTRDAAQELSQSSPVRNSSEHVIASNTDVYQPVLDDVLETYNLTPDSIVYRTMDAKYADLESMTVRGNPESLARVEDVYGPLEPNPLAPGVLSDVPKEIRAQDLEHPSLNVATRETSVRGYQQEGYVQIGIRVDDILSQGGRLYPDASAVIHNALVATIPNRVPFHIIG